MGYIIKDEGRKKFKLGIPGHPTPSHPSSKQPPARKDHEIDTDVTEIDIDVTENKTQIRK